MSTASAYLTVRGIDVDVVFKDIKNLHIGVYPPLGRVRVAAPSRLDDEDVRLAVVQTVALDQAPARQTAFCCAANRTADGQRRIALRLGRSPPPQVIERPGRAHIEVDGERLLLYVPAGTDADSPTRLA